MTITKLLYIECVHGGHVEGAKQTKDKRYLHNLNVVYFPKENSSIVFLLQYGHREHTRYVCERLV